MRTATIASIETTNEVAPKRERLNRKAPRAEDKLSFFRHATKAEMEAGASPLIYWAVEPSGDYGLDCKRGHAIAEELMAFLIEAPTVFNMTMLGRMLTDMQLFADKGHRGLQVGFGKSISTFALIGARIVGPDAVQKLNETAYREVGLAY